MYTDSPMEVTEPEVAARLILNGTEHCRIETNAGGRGFLRAIKKHLEKARNACELEEYPRTAGENKESRILTNAVFARDAYRFPHDWQARWGKFATAILNFRRKFKANDFDDAPDAVIGGLEVAGILDDLNEVYVSAGLNVYGHG